MAEMDKHIAEIEIEEFNSDDGAFRFLDLPAALGSPYGTATSEYRVGKLPRRTIPTKSRLGT